MRYYPPRLKGLAYRKELGNRGESDARAVYFALGEALHQPGLPRLDRDQAMILRRAIEDRYPGMRREEFNLLRQGLERDGKKVRPVPLKNVDVTFDAVGGTIEIPVARSKLPRQMTFVDREHLLDILAALALEGFINPETTLIRRSGSAIPYIQFAGFER
jgi:hypothetical protein